MFKRHSIQVSVVKNAKQETAKDENKPRLTKEDREIIKEMAKGTVIAVVAVMAASVVLNTAAQLLLIAAESGTDAEEED